MSTSRRSWEAGAWSARLAQARIAWHGRTSSMAPEGSSGGPGHMAGRDRRVRVGEPGTAVLHRRARQCRPGRGRGTWPSSARRVRPELARRRYGGCGYTSARLVSKDRVSFRYGLVQARMKIPRARGIWPAFWMLGQDIGESGWPGCGEIDVMEHFGTAPAAVHGTVHGPGFSGRRVSPRSHAVGPSLGRGLSRVLGQLGTRPGSAGT